MLNTPLVRKAVQLALEEDLAYGDITSELAVEPAVRAEGVFVAREPMVVCGTALLPLVAAEARSSARVTTLVSDGDRADRDASLAVVEGPARELLGLERTMLNFLQRLSGIATAASEFASAAGGVTVLDTRKTTPGLRVLEKYAVRCGGASNHRASLGDMVLVKNNHVDLDPGGIAAVLDRVFSRKPPYAPVEVEVRTLEELRAALEFPVSAVMLDNMTDEQAASAIELVRANRPGLPVEVSGGVRRERLAALAKIGAWGASSGALTTDARWMDISLRIRRAG